MPPKSIWRSADAQHFTLVHRSQRDPLINDPDAPSRVLAATQRRQGKGQPVTRKELEDEFKGKERKNIGEAAQYGVYYDDTEYDYMQHLRPIGGTYNAQRGGKDEEVDVDVVMLPGPQASTQDKGKAKAGGDLTFKEQTEKGQPPLDLPQEVLANNNEMPRDWARGTEEEGGLRLDMDPHLRQVLEALDDEAFLVGKAKQRRIEQTRQRMLEEAKQTNGDTDAAPSASSEGLNGLDFSFDDEDGEEFDDESEFDDLFATVIKSGEYDPTKPDNEEWRKLPPGGDEALYLTAAEKAKQKLQQGTGDDSQLSLSERVALFKEGVAIGSSANEAKSSAPQIASAKSRRAPSSIGGSSIFGDTPGKRSKPGSKARHAMSFYAPSADGGSTAWSMSSSAMERNAGLKGLDENFDRLEQIYEQDAEEEEDEAEDEGFVREDFESILDEFLEKHEVIAGKLKQRLGASDSSAAEKLDIIRKEVGQAKIDQWLSEREETQDEIDKDIEGRIRIVGLRKDEWDVETIQTTKTNVSNHPRMLSTRGSSVASGSSFRPATLGGLSSRSNGSSMNGGSEEFESIPKVRVNKRTGVSEVVGWTKQRKAKVDDDESVEDLPELTSLSIDGVMDEDDDGSGPPPLSIPLSHGSTSEEDDAESGEETETEDSFRRTVKRDRNESKEEKKARKDLAKQQKQERKKEKSERKAEFANERKRQVKMDAGRLKDGGAADLRIGAGKKLG